ncbi:MAG: hypothetical protein ACOX7O_10875, partial [Oscillospiraceae bacterium]
DTYLQYVSKVKKFERQLDLLKQLWKEEKSFPHLEEKLLAINDKLEVIKTSGAADEEFQKEFDDAEAEVWKNFKMSEPYFRERLFPSKLQLASLSLKGERKIDNMIRCSMQIGEDKFLVSSILSETRILSVKNGLIEWGEVIKDLSRPIVGCFNISENNWIAVKKNGEMVVFRVNDTENEIEVVKKLRSQFGKITGSVLIDENTIINVDEKRNFEKFYLAGDESFLPADSLPISDCPLVFMKKIKDKIIIIDYEGKMLIYDQGFIKEDELKLEMDRIIAVEALDENSVFVSNKNRQYKIFDLKSRKLQEEGFLEDRVMNVLGNQNCFLILSYNNNAYLMENNIGFWKLNEKATLENVNISNAAKYNENFIVFDLNGNASALLIDQFRCESI